MSPARSRTKSFPSIFPAVRKERSKMSWSFISNVATERRGVAGFSELANFSLGCAYEVDETDVEIEHNDSKKM